MGDDPQRPGVPRKSQRNAGGEPPTRTAPSRSLSARAGTSDPTPTAASSAQRKRCVAVTVDDATAQSIIDQLHAAGFSPASADGRVAEVFGDDHHVWASHSGGSGHFSEPEWDTDDVERAEAYYAQVRGKAKVFLDVLIDHPGRRLSTDQIRRLTPDTFNSDYAIAGSIKGLAKATSASGRRYPFYWWKARPTSYAMKPGVAAVFAAARDRVGR